MYRSVVSEIYLALAVISQNANITIIWSTELEPSFFFFYRDFFLLQCFVVYIETLTFRVFSVMHHYVQYYCTSLVAAMQSQPHFSLSKLATPFRLVGQNQTSAWDFEKNTSWKCTIACSDNFPTNEHQYFNIFLWLVLKVCLDMPQLGSSFDWSIEQCCSVWFHQPLLQTTEYSLTDQS